MRLLVDRMLRRVLLILVHLHQGVLCRHRPDITQTREALNCVGGAAKRHHVPDGRKAFVQEVCDGHMTELRVTQVAHNHVVKVPRLHQTGHIKATARNGKLYY